MHEHVLVDFIGAAEVSPARYDADDVFTRALPFLRQAKALGCATLVECTPAYLGRDPRLLRRLAEASGLHILSNTGYYGANKDKHLPPHAFTETPQQLAARWIRECEHGHRRHRDQAGLHEDRRRRRAAVRGRRQAGARGGDRAQGDRAADRRRTPATASPRSRRSTSSSGTACRCRRSSGSTRTANQMARCT